MQPNFKHPLGVKARCKVTGLEGIITTRIEELSGCNTYWLTPRVDKEGKRPDTYRIHEDEVEILDEKPIISKPPAGPSAG